LKNIGGQRLDCAHLPPAYGNMIAMMKDAKGFEEWENQLIASEPVDYLSNLRTIDEMVELARGLGVWPASDPLEGIEVDLKVARVINGLRPH
jgi:hypothetical protein